MRNSPEADHSPQAAMLNTSPNKTAGPISLTLMLLWLGVTLLAASAMYRLWATREWKLYAGKSIEAQRTTLFASVGFPNYLLRDTLMIARSLPPDADYRPKGDFNKLSYVQYLLIPRTPDPKAQITLRDTGSALILTPAPPPPQPLSPERSETPDALSLLLAFIIVYGTGSLLRLTPGFPVSIPQSILIGLLAGTLTVTASRAFLQTATPGFILWSLAGAGGIALDATLRIRRRSRAGSAQFFRLPSASATVLLLLGGGFTLWTLLMAVVVGPDDWDAWAMWGAKAKALALGTGPLAEVTRFGSPEYPLLWPSLWALTGWLAGGWEEHWAKGWGAILLALTGWQLTLHARATSTPDRSPASALAPATLFVTMPFVALAASWAYADPAYWLAMACTWSALHTLREKATWHMALVGGLSLGACMHAKNEGTVFTALACLWLLLQRTIPRQHKLTALSTAFLAFLPWALWTRFAQGFETTSAGGFITSAEAFDRLARIGAATGLKLAQIVADPRLWGASLIIIAATIAWTAAKGTPRERRSLAIPAALLLSYLAVVLLGRNDPLWQVGVAWSRLTTHLLLLAILLTGNHIAHAFDLACETAGRTFTRRSLPSPSANLPSR